MLCKSRSILAVLLFTVIRYPKALAIIITPPTSALDYKDVASLVVATFDAPSTDGAEYEAVRNKFNLLQWNLIDRSLTEDFTYRQYVRTARRMRGKKYCLLVAKEYQDDNALSSSYDVVGMVEMGMSLCPKPKSSCTSTDAEGGTYKSQSAIGVTGDSPRPTIGVLCIKSTHQNQGIGRALVQRCEEIVHEVWKEHEIFVDVEPNNQKALAFFANCGYEYAIDESEAKLVRDTKVFRRRVEEVKPHWLLRKSLGEEDR